MPPELLATLVIAFMVNLPAPSSRSGVGGAAAAIGDDVDKLDELRDVGDGTGDDDAMVDALVLREVTPLTPDAGSSFVFFFFLSCCRFLH